MKPPTAKELHAALERLRGKARSLRDELGQTDAKIAALERLDPEQSSETLPEDPAERRGGATAGHE